MNNGTSTGNILELQDGATPVIHSCRWWQLDGVAGASTGTAIH